MKLGWLEKTAFALAPVYPAALVLIRQPHWIADAVVVCVDFAVVVLLIIALAKGAPRDFPAAICALVFVISDNGLLKQLASKPAAPFTALAALATAGCLLAFFVAHWRQKKMQSSADGQV
jgi:hypothetical protein